MELFKNPLIDAIIVIACAAIVYLANRGDSFGKFFDRLSPCTQDPTASFPCYGMYDVGVMVLAGIIGIIFLIALILRMFENTQ